MIFLGVAAATPTPVDPPLKVMLMLFFIFIFFKKEKKKAVEFNRLSTCKIWVSSVTFFLLFSTLTNVLL